MDLNLASASIDSAALSLPKLASSLPQAQALLEKESLNEAVRYFNPNRDVERDSAASKEMCKTYLKQIQKAAREHGLLLAEAAEAAAAVYTGLVGGRRTTEFRRIWHSQKELAGEDGSGRCSCDLVASPNIATSGCASAARCVGEAEHKTRSSPASGGCGWVPRYEDGATHDHSMGGARRGTVTHPKP